MGSLLCSLLFQLVLKTSKDWLYRRWRTLPFAVQLSPRQLRFSLKGLQEYIEERRHGRTRV